MENKNTSAAAMSVEDKKRWREVTIDAIADRAEGIVVTQQVEVPAVCVVKMGEVVFETRTGEERDVNKDFFAIIEMGRGMVGGFSVDKGDDWTLQERLAELREREEKARKMKEKLERTKLFGKEKEKDRKILRKLIGLMPDGDLEKLYQKSVNQRECGERCNCDDCKMRREVIDLLKGPEGEDLSDEDLGDLLGGN